MPTKQYMHANVPSCQRYAADRKPTRPLLTLCCNCVCVGSMHNMQLKQSVMAARSVVLSVHCCQMLTDATTQSDAALLPVTVLCAYNVIAAILYCAAYMSCLRERDLKSFELFAVALCCMQGILINVNSNDMQTAQHCCSYAEHSLHKQVTCSVSEQQLCSLCTSRFLSASVHKCLREELGLLAALEAHRSTTQICNNFALELVVCIVNLQTAHV